MRPSAQTHIGEGWRRRLFVVARWTARVLALREQMYQALRSLGVETQLVIYPGQFHGLTRPSFLADRMSRYLSWYGSHLGVEGTPDTVARH